MLRIENKFENHAADVHLIDDESTLYIENPFPVPLSSQRKDLILSIPIWRQPHKMLVKTHPAYRLAL